MVPRQSTVLGTPPTASAITSSCQPGASDGCSDPCTAQGSGPDPRSSGEATGHTRSQAGGPTGPPGEGTRQEGRGQAGCAGEGTAGQDGSQGADQGGPGCAREVRPAGRGGGD